MIDPILLPVGLVAATGIDVWAWVGACFTAEELGKIDDWVAPIRRGFRLKNLVPRYVPLFIAVALALVAHEGGEFGNVAFAAACVAMGVYVLIAALIFYRALRDYVWESTAPHQRSEVQ